MSALNQSNAISAPLKKYIRSVIEEETRNCLRLYKAKVISAPNGSTMSVQLIGDSETLKLPYSTKVSSVTSGCVWVATFGNDFRNAVVYETYNTR